jgi:hypothetical protein
VKATGINSRESGNFDLKRGGSMPENNLGIDELYRFAVERWFLMKKRKYKKLFYGMLIEK